MRTTLLLVLLTLAHSVSYADIHIGGDVYGGGKNGAVGTGNTTSTAETAKESVTLTDAAKASTAATEVVIYDGNVRTVFGGGMNGRVYGKTSVEIDGGAIGGDEWAGTIHGGVFGAGDGAQAYVFGHDEVKIKGGTVYNSVYGGGNQADLVGSTSVVLQGGTVYGNVFGGARMADVEGHSYVNIDGANATNDLIVKAVYGGNDIAGNIKLTTNNTNWTWLASITKPFTTKAKDAATLATWSTTDAIDNTYNAFVQSTSNAATPKKNIFIGSLFGGGNGDYDYEGSGNNLSLTLIDTPAEYYKEGESAGEVKTAAVNADPFTGLSLPELAKTYLQIEGGTFGYVYGGGNKATVKTNTDIYIENPDVPCEILASEMMRMGLQSNTYLLKNSTTEIKKADYDAMTDATAKAAVTATLAQTIDRVFGGNNLADMSIRPEWYLIQGRINNLYSGGNKGRMTSNTGILLNIFQNTGTDKDLLHVNNVYGGCRMADVTPMDGTTPITATDEETDFGYTFPANYAARVYVGGGKINNVYGGNDVSGEVKLGTDVEIQGAISGDVYGGGNGSYVYTDNSILATADATKEDWADYYYAPGANSAQELNKKRPHVENTLVHISGTEDNRVYVTGGVYCGGNSATIDGTNAKAEFKIGTYVTLDKIFLGSNGVNMVKESTMEDYTSGKVGSEDISRINLTESADMEEYMKGVEVNIFPTISWDVDASGNSALDKTTYIGSFFCGGNVGSMSAPGAFSESTGLKFPDDLIIYDKIVGGCNDANVPYHDGINAFYQGGVTVATGDNSPKLTLNVNSILEPKRLKFEKNDAGFIDSDRPLYLYWNTDTVKLDNGSTDPVYIFKGANIYGGCYNSGYVNGDVVININKPLISDSIANIGVTTALYKVAGEYNSTKKEYTPTDQNVQGLRTQRDYIFASTLAAYGGGYGEQTEIWGDVTINLSENAGILKVYGGGEQGIVGKIKRDDTTGAYLTETDGRYQLFDANSAYNATVNLKSDLVKPEVTTDTSTGNDLFNVARVYGGGFQGVVTGNTALYLGGGKVSEAIAGAANADIYGCTEMFIGRDLAGPNSYDNAKPFVAAREFSTGGNVYGGNDFGGKIWGTKQHTVAAVSGGMTEKKVTSNTYVEYQRGLIGNSVYGGACGSYDYSDLTLYPVLAKKKADGTFDLDSENKRQADPNFVKPTLLETVTAGTGDTYTANTFVNVASPEASRDVAFVGYPVYEDNKKTGDHGAFFGGGKGYLDLEEIVDVDKTYVLLHATTTRTNDEFLTPDVYGGGYYSDVHNTMVDAYTGNFDIIYGGTFGATANQNATPHLTKANYQNTTTTINTYPSFTTNPNITIYGSGGYVGTKTTNVNLFGGTLGNVYGGSFNEGVCNVTNVNVMSSSDAVASGWQYAGTFAGSTVNVKALFGGSQGSADALPCDVLQSNVKFHSDQAYVRGEDNEDEAYIYGGNHDYRATEHTLVEITVPVRKVSGGNLVNVCGAGYGAHTVAGFTHVDLKDNALVNNVYGGGRDGKVLNRYDILTTSDPADDASGYVPYDAAEDGDKKTSDNIQTYAYWTTPANTPNTLIDLAATSTVRGSMFGAGFGEDATVAGTTQINSYGTVDYYIYGGGYAGDVREMASTDLGYVSTAAHSTAGTIVNVLGGKTQKVYGGGSQGDVGALVGTDYNNATTTVNIGSKTGTPSTEGGTTPAPTYEDGVPTILFSAYGGGEMGKVYGTANVTMNNGYIGYEYRTATLEEITAINAEHAGDAGWTALTDGAKWYFPNLKASEDDTNDKLYQYGNLYGAGFGEGAVTLNTDVKIYGGTIRNSLYGGGEVAAVGFATPDSDGKTYTTESVVKSGFAKVTMYEGNVGGSVFGGGRGYSYTVEDGVAIGSQYYSDGYTFGQTEVNIHGGVIGTDESLALGEGNVFGGGNIGYVYSGSGTKAVADNATNHITKGYYYNSSNALTEDCKVVVSPYCKVTDDDGVTFSDVKFAKDDVIPADILAKAGSLTDVDANGKVTADDGVTITSLSYAKGDYVPTEVLNTINDGKSDVWQKLDQTGIIIRNAVFAGGNVTQGSDIMYVEATTVFGNVTASVVDLFSKDLITLGNDDVGGLYGDGNLTFVDGYRELNITNYGTDYYGLNFEISMEEYAKLNNRQRAYFSIQYKDKNTNAKITEEEYNALSESEKSNYIQAGFCSLYAGRMMNTIQRADFCGVFGSRIVLKGAQDRVPAVVDYTKYTINRVGEVSLNQVKDPIEPTVAEKIHGNYFGMYSVVNYLGALTSDVAFNSTRKTQSATHPADETNPTYDVYKRQYLDKSYRNNGESANIVALASGVFLELVKDLDSNGNKNYGPITGVVQLDLISVKTGEGGGYVYAKNEHGAPSASHNTHLTLTAANNGAVTQESFEYDKTNTGMETSGNFVHSTKRIVDDCFPTGNYATSPAHYWYIKGDYYVYDQYISAYTGSANSYAETINIPLSIQAATNGKIKLENIQPNLYAYFDPDGTSGNMPQNQNTGQQLELNDVLYDQNEPISYWDWSLMPSGEQSYFLQMTYVCPRDIIVGGSEVKDSDGKITGITGGTTYTEGQVFKAETLPVIEDGTKIYLAKDYSELTYDEAFHLTNGVNSENGLVLAVSMSNPYKWDEYHTTQDAATTKKDIRAYNALESKTDYLLAPTYNHNVSSDAVYGQSAYKKGAFVPKATKTSYDAISSNVNTSTNGTQATFEAAYKALEACDYTDGTGDHHVVKGGCIPATVWNGLGGLQSKFEPAYLCTTTRKLAEDKYLIINETYGTTEMSNLISEYSISTVDQAILFDEAYICTGDGNYGGKLYAQGINFDAADYTALNDAEREKFIYNWDALDILSNDHKNNYNSGAWPTTMVSYDGTNSAAPTYSAAQPIDYEATYRGTPETTTAGDALVTKPASGSTEYGSVTVKKDETITREVYESLLNEKANYVLLDNSGGTTNRTFYVTKEQVSAGPTLYDKGRVLTAEEYGAVSDQSKVESVEVGPGKHFCCVNTYKTRDALTTETGTNSIAANGQVDWGTIIPATTYESLPNDQANFLISGTTPIEKSTLYVSRDINPFDVTQDRIFTVIYQYSYVEADEEGTSFENITERHVLNIHVHFESGVPSIGELAKPATILPGSTVGLNTPVVTPGAFEVIGGGFEVFEKKTDAENQQNGVEWTNFETPMYWYQNDWYVAYYAETYLGKTYSNAVPFTVANYHSMEKVMTDPTHLYIDRNDVSRDCRIYLDNHECTDNTKNDLDYLKEFFDASLKTGDSGDNKAVFRLYDKDKEGNTITPSPYIKGGNHLQFILNSDIDQAGTTDWSSLGDDTQCFAGTLHGNGHTISGLENSLFGKLCGNVYNLGVTGSFTGGGIAEKGDENNVVENCWVQTTGTPTEKKAVVSDNNAAILNCYYPASNKYADNGKAIKKPDAAFLNGEVAYNLNRFYLRKRFADAKTTSGNEYKYFALNQSDNTLTLMDGSDDNHKLGHYPDDFVPTFTYQDATGTTKKLGYVEHYYMDGDYIYANGKIPEKDNERYVKTDLKHYPIYPDDYIFFGQKLTYNTTTHNATPTAIMKTVTKDANGVEHERIERSNSTTENRVYRAPAYFRSKEQSKAYYNRDAAFVAQYTPTGGTAVDIHKGMTAIDFTGYNDAVATDATSAESQTKFYAPWLDYEGLSSIKTDGLTKNLLAYAKAGTAEGDVDNLSAGVLNAYFTEPVYKEESETYRNVKVPETAGSVKGHVVLKDGDDYTAFSDHYLVDKQDFNAPIAYAFDDDNRMWYQRKPDNYAAGAAGWEGVSLPFAAELVTTQDKGEITHFYEGSTVGHEYWLREYTSGGAADTENSSIFRAAFKVPNTQPDNDKEYKNTYLYDRYYSVDGKDKNGDEYQKGYYSETHTFEDYPFSAAGTPYIAGFPGAMYYEFDLSGNFQPANTSSTVTTDEAKRGAQTITFASAEGGSIGVSDDECSVVKNGSYEFVPTYLNNNLEAGKYVLNSEGSSFDKTSAATQSYAFRPYFQNAPAGVKGETTRSIVFGNTTESLFDKDSEKGKELDGGLAIYAKRGAIVVSSTMKEEQAVSINNAAGVTIANFMIQPGETRITPIHSSGVYIVNEKKLSVK